MSDTSKPRLLAVIILAAGKGKRMNNPEMAKVMYEISGKPMVEFVVELAVTLQASRTLIVVGWQKQMVMDYFASKIPIVEFVEQTEQLGTGHAVLQVAEVLKDFEGDVLVLSGDVHRPHPHAALPARSERHRSAWTAPGQEQLGVRASVRRGHGPHVGRDLRDQRGRHGPR